MIRKRLLSACLALALCLGLLPVTALAAEGAPNTLYVGNQNVKSGGDITYWSTNDSGGLTWVENATDNSDDWNVKYDPNTATLTLNGATINGAHDATSPPYGSGIYALCSSKQPVALTIELIGTNTITGNYGIYVDAQQGETAGTNASLLIRNSSDNGMLEVSGSFYGIYVKSGTGDASLNINDASVVAKTTQTYSGYAGVYVQSSAYATSSPQLSLAVNGGSLTTSASEGNDGIQFHVGAYGVTSETTSLSVTNNAIVDARNGGISASRISVTLPTPTPTGNNSSGIVFDDKNGTVYGDVTLQEDLEIGEGESLTIPNGTSLTIDNDATLTNEGTVTNSGTLTNNGKIENSGTLPSNIGGTAPPSITTTSLAGGIVGEAYNATLEASGTGTITWSNSGDLPAGLTLSESTGVISGTPTTSGTSDFTVTATNSGGSDSEQLSITISSATNIPVQSVSLDKTSLGLTEGETAQLTATVLPDNATNKNVTWSTSNASIATVDANGLVTAVSAGTATITVTTEDGSFTANCTVTVREDVPDRPVSIPDTHEIELIAGEGGEAKTNFSNAGAGTKITVAATPDAGYELAYITVDGERISGVSFTMPAHDVTVRVYFTGGALPFADVTEGAWYYDAVSYVYVNGLMDGVSASEFAPDANMTRAMLVTILWRLEGEPVVNYLMPFADVDGGAWYAEAVRWAASEGIVEGVSASEFAPDAEITREQLAAILWRYAGEPATAANLAAFTDAASVSAYAADATAWCVEQGIITGTTATTLAPQGAATRAQCAAMLMRFAER